MSNASTTNKPQTASKKIWPLLWRGFLNRCPQCGQGKLLVHYIKPVNECNHCDANITEIKADDGPAWLTILITGHLLAPAMLSFIPQSTWPEWLLMIIWPFIALILALLILPRAKGVFIAMLWHLHVSENNPPLGD
ncbi:MAG: DUF983 domain-containing protein [Alphaproteobacteria bacterium]